jgi:muramidase (phage lysozyme)
MARIDARAAGGRNRVAFLDMLAWSEIGADLLAITDDGYDVLVGATARRPLTFDGYADHPNVRNTTLKSTAAGRYQILYRWWMPYRKQLGLPDFSPLSQDRYALQQIHEQGAALLIDAGRITDAIARVAKIWASLPGAGYQQPEHRLVDLLAAYQAAGGELLL